MKLEELLVAQGFGSGGRRLVPLPVALQIAVLAVQFVAFLQHHTKSDGGKQVFHSRVLIGFLIIFQGEATTCVATLKRHSVRRNCSRRVLRIS